MECHLSASPDPQPGHPGTCHDAQNSVGQVLGFPGGAGGKEPTANVNTGGRHSNPHYSLLGNPMDRGAC